jgi:gluconate 2-dehydrogenase gamma chain
MNSASLKRPWTSRRDVLKILLAAPAATLSWTDAEALQAASAAQMARAAAQPFTPRFFTPVEFRLVSVLADIVIPKDERSGSATDAGVPEFMDFMMLEQPARQVAMRGGLAWLDHECQVRFDELFIDCTDQQRVAVLDDIAWPERAKPEFAHGVAFFSSFRDLTAAGFWTTRMGIDDLQYLGNRSVARWNGCPDAALEKLGVRYE